MIIKSHIWLFFFFLGCNVAFAQVEVPSPDSISVFGPTLDSLRINRIKKYSLDSLRTNMLKNNPLDSVRINLPDSLASKVIDKSRKVIDPILTSGQRYKQAPPENNIFRIPTLETEMGKDKISGIQKGIYPQIQPELPDLKASAVKLKEKSSELEKFSDTEKYAAELKKIQIIRDSLSTVDRDSVISSLTQEVEEKATGLLASEFGALLMEDAGVPDMASLIESQTSTEDYNAKRMLEKFKQANHFEDRELVDKQREKLDVLKKKYKQVPDSRELDAFAKRSSLADHSLFERLEYGLMLRNPTAKPFRFDLNTFVGYRINKLFALGGGAWLGMIPERDIKLKYAGISLYAMHKVHKSLFAVGGYDIAGRGRKLTNENSAKSAQIWAGIGTETELFRKIKMRSQVSYGFTQLIRAYKDEFRSPWAVSLGIVHFK
ncbi:hypothetical protein [Lunatibacter salilacus]|uniref:hypothetical protein n=1 Tax=Lunatibacter salilacus TaxID=2483804 RepID=UPI00131C5A6A|nr:hypothetical protein [Lunatibacter salilacus]